MDVSTQPWSTGFHRTLLALSAALVAIAFCVARGHVQIVPGDSSTYASALHHRCGQMMVACVVWALFELTAYLRPLALVPRS